MSKSLSDQKCSLWKPSRTTRLLCNTQFYFPFHSTLSANATEESYRNKAIQSCLLSCKSVQYFLKISQKSSRFFFLEKYQETCVCENRIHKIQTSTGLYKSISVCLMTKKIFQIILSSSKFWSNILISTKHLTHLPLPKQTIATKRAIVMLLFALLFTKIILLQHPHVPSAAVSC